MWIVVHMAYNKADAYKIKDTLTNEGFLVKLKVIGKEDGVYEILVLEEEAQEAHEVLVNIY